MYCMFCCWPEIELPLHPELSAIFCTSCEAVAPPEFCCWSSPAIRAPLFLLPPEFCCCSTLSLPLLDDLVDCAAIPTCNAVAALNCCCKRAIYCCCAACCCANNIAAATAGCCWCWRRASWASVDAWCKGKADVVDGRCAPTEMACYKKKQSAYS